MNLENIKRVDPAVAGYIEDELKRQQTTIELIASENFTSTAVMEACGSVLTNKYAEGKPNKRYYNGCDYIDKIEEFLKQDAGIVFRFIPFSKTTVLRLEQPSKVLQLLS